MLNRILIIGAGKSSPFLIEYLYERRFNLNIDLTVLADKKPDYFVKNFKDLNFIKVNINDSNVLKGLVDKSYIVISLLPPTLHFKIAQICSEVGVNMITASYLDENIKKLHDSFLKNDSFLFMEMGLDPGIDHMSAMKVIDELKITSKILEFESYTGGLIDYDKEENPWGYKFTWNPMNVILAGSDDAYYIENYKKVFVPYKKLFKNIKDINIPGVGYFEGYPNRDSLKYKDLYKLDNIKNLRRGTLRNKSFCGSWNIFVQLGLTDNDFVINNAHKMSHFDFFSMKKFSKDKSSFLRFIQDEYNLENDCDEIKNLKWIGMFSDEKISLSSGTSAEILLHIINKKWTLNDNELDLIVMYHKFIFEENGIKKVLFSYLKVRGENKIKTAMAKTVGLPIAILVEYIIESGLQIKGINLPFDKKIYTPVLNKLKYNGISFEEKVFNI